MPITARESPRREMGQGAGLRALAPTMGHPGGEHTTMQSLMVGAVMLNRVLDSHNDREVG